MATISYLTTAQFDFGAIRLVSAECARLGIRRPLIVTDAGIRACGLLDRLREALEAQRRDLESRLQTVEGELALVRGSRIWQMTAPIRRAVSWLRQWRGRFSSH